MQLNFFLLAFGNLFGRYAIRRSYPANAQLTQSLHIFVSGKKYSKPYFLTKAKYTGTTIQVHTLQDYSSYTSLGHPVYSDRQQYVPPPYRSCILADFGSILHTTVFRTNRSRSKFLSTQATPYSLNHVGTKMKVNTIVEAAVGLLGRKDELRLNSTR